MCRRGRRARVFDGERVLAALGRRCVVDGGRVVAVLQPARRATGRRRCSIDHPTTRRCCPGWSTTHAHLCCRQRARCSRAGSRTPSDEEMASVIETSLRAAARGRRDDGPRPRRPPLRRASSGATRTAPDAAFPRVLASGPPITTPGRALREHGRRGVPAPSALLAAVRERAERRRRRGEDHGQRRGEHRRAATRPTPQFDRRRAAGRGDGGAPPRAPGDRPRALGGRRSGTCIDAGVDAVEHASVRDRAPGSRRTRRP